MGEPLSWYVFSIGTVSRMLLSVPEPDLKPCRRELSTVLRRWLGAQCLQAHVALKRLPSVGGRLGLLGLLGGRLGLLRHLLFRHPTCTRKPICAWSAEDLW